MGNIIESKILPNRKIVLKISVDRFEALALRGTLRKIHVFSEGVSSASARILEKGKLGVSKYLEIPKQFRHRSWNRLKNVEYQAIDTDAKMIFICICDRPGAKDEIY